MSFFVYHVINLPIINIFNVHIFKMFYINTINLLIITILSQFIILKELVNRPLQNMRTNVNCTQRKEKIVNYAQYNISGINSNPNKL